MYTLRGNVVSSNEMCFSIRLCSLRYTALTQPNRVALLQNETCNSNDIHNTPFNISSTRQSCNTISAGRLGNRATSSSSFSIRIHSTDDIHCCIVERMPGTNSHYTYIFHCSIYSRTLD